MNEVIAAGKKLKGKIFTTEFILAPENNHRLMNLCGRFDEHLKLIEHRMDVQIHNRGNQFKVEGHKENIELVKNLLIQLYESTLTESLTPNLIHLALQPVESHSIVEGESHLNEKIIYAKRLHVRTRGKTQFNYVEAIEKNDINFGIGPAGTGKTYLAVACAVAALEAEKIERIILVRPAIEAGEKLGFLPGDIAEKINPYLRPLYDALYEMIGFEKLDKLIERQIIEVAPLAYMRGRTLNDAFIILDEGQNTTPEQMKMFLTRLGFNSKAVITGDVTQIDLPKNQASGLIQSSHILKNVKGISQTYFNSSDVVRHPLVQRIIEAYESYEDANDNHNETD